jgi:cell division protein FtsB
MSDRPGARFAARRSASPRIRGAARGEPSAGRPGEGSGAAATGLTGSPAEPWSSRLDAPAVRATILLVVLAAIVLSLAVPLRQFIRQTDENQALAEGIAAQQQRVAELERREELWQDPAFAAGQARERLHFVYPGEVGYIVLGAGERPLTGPDVRQQDNGDGWYSRLWESVRSAGE